MEAQKKDGAWQRIKSSAGWGLFLGICDWVLASAITRKLPRGAVWAIIAGQVVIGLIAGIEKWKAAWWVKGLAFGLGLNLVLAFGLAAGLPEWGRPLFIPLLLAGAVVGLISVWVMRKKA